MLQELPDVGTTFGYNIQADDVKRTASTLYLRNKKLCLPGYRLVLFKNRYKQNSLPGMGGGLNKETDLKFKTP